MRKDIVDYFCVASSFHGTWRVKNHTFSRSVCRSLNIWDPRRARSKIFLPEITDQRSGIEDLSQVYPWRVHKDGYTDSCCTRHSVAKIRVSIRVRGNHCQCELKINLEFRRSHWPSFNILCLFVKRRLRIYCVLSGKDKYRIERCTKVADRKNFLALSILFKKKFVQADVCKRKLLTHWDILFVVRE